MQAGMVLLQECTVDPLHWHTTTHCKTPVVARNTSIMTEYLRAHDIRSLMESLLQSLLEERPPDPRSFLVELLRAETNTTLYSQPIVEAQDTELGSDRDDNEDMTTLGISPASTMENFENATERQPIGFSRARRSVTTPDLVLSAQYSTEHKTTEATTKSSGGVMRKGTVAAASTMMDLRDLSQKQGEAHRHGAIVGRSASVETSMTEDSNYSVDAILQQEQTDAVLSGMLSAGVGVAHDTAVLSTPMEDADGASSSSTQLRSALSTAQALNEQGARLVKKHKYEDALRLFQHAKDILVQHLGAKHTEVAHALNNMGLVLRRTHQLTQAQHAFEEALAIDLANLSHSDPLVGTTMFNLALVHEELKHLDRALNLFKSVLHIKQHAPYESEQERAAAVGKVLFHMAFVYKTKGLDHKFHHCMAKASAMYIKGHGLQHSKTQDSIARLLDLQRGAAHPTAIEHRRHRRRKSRRKSRSKGDSAELKKDKKQKTKKMRQSNVGGGPVPTISEEQEEENNDDESESLTESDE